MPTIAGTVYQNLKYVDEGKNEKERIQRMHEIQNLNIKTILDYTFNPKVEWVLEDNIKYKPSKDEPKSLTKVLMYETKRLPIFLNVGDYANLDKKKKTNIFIQTLENCHPDDAILLMSCKDKKLPFKNITPAFLKKCYPKGFASKW